MRFSSCILFGVCLYLAACSTNKDQAADGPDAQLFTLLPADSTGITFSNTLTEGLNTNVMMYEYFYNGGGVAVGDLNADGLEDIYFTANMSDNKLYLNKGNMQFEDITQAAGVQNRNAPWRTGVTIADVNGDSRPDIFVAYSGKVRAENRVKQLFINQGNNDKGIPLFKEQAKEYGLADTSFCTQAFFFDYDRDGDLDMFSLNHNPNNLPVLDEANTAQLLTTNDPGVGVRLFNNHNNYFTDVTMKAGFSSSFLTYGLGAGIADVNGDGWSDIYIANDYNVPDYLYINNGNGTFTDKLQTSMGHTSRSSMGNNISDINNDGLPDIYVLDMLPEDNQRQKLLFMPDNYEKFNLILRSGFYYQYMRNTLQVNNGDGTFSETGQLSGISNTDWSWTPLFADYDNDGWKDLYITNGYHRDFTNMDFLKYMNSYVDSKGRLKREDILELLKKMPSSDVSNYLFKNNGNLTFKDVSKQWNIAAPSNSNGAAYADFDNDGDLDLVVSNINKPAFIYRNEADKKLGHQYLKVKLKGTGKNTDGLGAKVYIYYKGNQQLLEQMPARGYQSTVSAILHFGLGSETVIDSLRVIWLSGKQQVLANVKASQLITLDEKDAVDDYRPPQPVQPFFEEVASPVNYSHAANTINDFKRQPLLVNPLSFFGPCIVKGDVNNDKLEDLYIGGANGQAGALFLQQPGKQFKQIPQPAFETDKICEDADAVFVDVNNDGFADLYVASGGYHRFAPDDAALQDRLYINDGKGNFTKATGALPSMTVSKSCVRVTDINGDGFADLFIGGRIIPGQYPETPASFLLINDGNGKFSDQVTTLAPQLQHAGMVTDAAWIDINADNRNDLVVTGEWMPVMVFINSNGKLENKTTDYFDKEYSGWWNKLHVADLNGDGKQDLVIGNTGLNTQCRASDEEPAELYYKDFDQNGAIDPILCFYIQHKSYPYVTRDELLDQIAFMRARFTDYKSYANATLKDIFLEEELEGTKRLQATCLNTTFFERGADGKFHEKTLPLQAQYAPVHSILSFDYDKDGNTDLLLCGNCNQARLKIGKCDANFGVLLKGDGKGNFAYVPQQQSGFKLWGDVRSVTSVNDLLLFGINQNQLKAYKAR